MNSKKQLLANQQNAQFSTGPKTIQGKATVASNAIKHGIFTKDLLVSTSFGKENEGEYHEMLNNLMDCLTPQNQMENLLVEKIAIDFWRLRRVIRFEAGSIGKSIEAISKEFYSYGKKNSGDLDAEIQTKKEDLAWIATYLKCLKNEEVSFEKPVWKGEEIESDIHEDLQLIIKSLDDIPYKERESLLYNASFAKLKSVLEQNGHSSKKEISEKLIEIYSNKIERLKHEIEDLEQKRLGNAEADILNALLGMLPQTDNTEKILKYEKSLQKSIFQNLFLLKKLQGSC